MDGRRRLVYSLEHDSVAAARDPELEQSLTSLIKIYTYLTGHAGLVL